MLWDINVQCDNVIEARGPVIILIDKKEQKVIIINIAIPADQRVEKKEREKILKRETGRLWKLKMVEVVPVNGSSWKYHKRIWWMDWKTRDNKQCWSDAKDCIVGNGEDIDEKVGYVKKRSFCWLLVFCCDSSNRTNYGNGNSQNIC